jgi:hypothetical protein
MKLDLHTSVFYLRASSCFSFPARTIADPEILMTAGYVHEWRESPGALTAIRKLDAPHPTSSVAGDETGFAHERVLSPRFLVLQLPGTHENKETAELLVARGRRFGG